MTTDWMREAADAICDEVYETSGPGTGISSDEMVAIIAKHCPMLPNVAYMPVPRCETCAHWDAGQRNDGKGYCDEPWVMAIVPKEFGCVQWRSKDATAH